MVVRSTIEACCRFCRQEATRNRAQPLLKEHRCRDARPTEGQRAGERVLLFGLGLGQHQLEAGLLEAELRPRIQGGAHRARGGSRSRAHLLAAGLCMCSW